MIAVLVVLLLSFPVMRGYARRLERAEGDRVEKLHRLRRANLILVGLLVAAIVLSRFEGALDADLFGGAAPVARLVVMPLMVIAVFVVSYLATRPVYERLRGIEGTTKGAPQRLTRQLLVLLAPQLVWLGVFIVLLRLDAPAVAVFTAVVAFVISIAVLGPFLIRAAMPTRAASARDVERLARLCAEHGVTIRGLRVIDTGHDPAANALFSGFGPGPKSVFVTDRLLESLNDDELAAVLAHEIGHRKKHHIAIKLAAHFGTILAVTLVVVGLLPLTHDAVPDALAAILLPILMLGSVLLVQGTLGVRLEHRADDYAASTAGAEPLVAALHKIADINMMKRRTGWFWNIMQQHPGLDSRIQRLTHASSSSVPTAL